MHICIPLCDIPVPIFALYSLYLYDYAYVRFVPYVPLTIAFVTWQQTIFSTGVHPGVAIFALLSFVTCTLFAQYTYTIVIIIAHLFILCIMHSI